MTENISSDQEFASLTRATEERAAAKAEAERAEKLGVISGGSLSAGLDVKLDRDVAIEELAVGRYVVLPDHIHMFVAPVLGRPLEPWVTFWKRSVTRAHGNPAWRWQTDHWDRRLRREESYAQKWQYVALNPVRHGLVKRPEDWPYQGELNTLAWWG